MPDETRIKKCEQKDWTGRKIGHKWSGFVRSKTSQTWSRHCVRGSCHAAQTVTEEAVASGMLPGVTIRPGRRGGAPVLILP